MIIIKYPKMDKKEIDSYKVDVNNFMYFKIALQKERKKLIEKLKEYENAGIIKWKNKPRNKYIQKELDEMVIKKRILLESLNQINKIFLN
ncbi:MAG: hypothetical protein AABY22_10405 [Nanoarchaeota archaeon]